MSDPLAKYEYFGDFSEVFEVIRTVLVVKNDQLYRIEVIKSYSSFNIPYTVYCWVEKDKMWVRHDMPGVVEYNADKALEEALTSLG
jgi:hypothetical protein